VDAKELRELIEIISRSNFSTFELERKDFKLRLVKGNSVPHAVAAAGAAPPEGGALPAASPAAESAGASPGETVAAGGVVELRSPIVGTFYEAPSPGAPPFVTVGDRVQKGQVLCIVEAMKLMNEIEAEFDAEVLEAVAVNGQPVEFGEILFRLRPAA
jgi:acetyl-CoA carboxylase biotin carboxyl carrier protein